MESTASPKKRKLKTIWRVPDDLWEIVRTFLPPEKAPGTPGCPVVPFRKVLDGILYVLRTGCQWKVVPKEFGSGSTCHRRFQEWVELGVFRKVWEVLLERYDELHGIAWEWQALDSISGKAPLGGEETGPNPTDRGKLGTKRHLLTDQRGTPLAVAITGANRHDMKTTESTLDGVVVTHPAPSEERLQHLCTDKGYDYPETREAVKARGYVPHIKRRGVESTPTEGEKRYPARRWVVERTLSWLNRFRKLLIRWEKKVGNYLGLVQFACCLIVYRRLKVLG